MSDWKIERRHGVCAVSGVEFKDGDPIFSMLAVEDGAVARRDVARDAWSQVDVEDDAIFWRTRFQEKKAGRLLDLESIEALFLALEPKQEAPRHEAFEELRYLLALILVRKRKLKIASTRRSEEDGEALVLKRPRHTGDIVVRVFELSQERSAVLREVLQRIFDGADLDEVAQAVTESPEPSDAPEGAEPDESSEGAADGAEPETADPVQG